MSMILEVISLLLMASYIVNMFNIVQYCVVLYRHAAKYTCCEASKENNGVSSSGALYATILVVKCNVGCPCKRSSINLRILTYWLKKF